MYVMLQHGSDLMDMFFKCIRVNQDIINVDNDGLIQHVLEDVINEYLEHRRTVDQPERHNKIFTVPCRG